MKSFRIFLAGVTVAFIALLSPMTAVAASTDKQPVSSLLAAIPTELVVKQIATLNDGKEVTIYYKKVGDFCEIYSDNNLKGYTENDLLKLTSTSFSFATEVKGDRIFRCSIEKALKIFKPSWRS